MSYRAFIVEKVLGRSSSTDTAILSISTKTENLCISNPAKSLFSLQKETLYNVFEWESYSRKSFSEITMDQYYDPAFSKTKGFTLEEVKSFVKDYIDTRYKALQDDGSGTVPYESYSNNPSDFNTIFNLTEEHLKSSPFSLMKSQNGEKGPTWGLIAYTEEDTPQELRD